MGVGREDRRATWILKISEKKVVFLVSSSKKQISPLLAPPWKNFVKIHLRPLPGKILTTMVGEVMRSAVSNTTPRFVSP